jgi:DNA topoisomerase-3
VQAFRGPTSRETAIMQATLKSLAAHNNQSIGTLHRNEGGAMERSDFDAIVSALLRGCMVKSYSVVFVKEGKSITFLRLTVTPQGKNVKGEALSSLQVPAKTATRKPGAKSRTNSKSRTTPTSQSQSQPKPKPKSNSSSKRGDAPRTSRVDAALRAWRKDEAAKKRVPAFRIMTDKTLQGVALARPEDETALLAIFGVGPSLVAKHGEKILQIVRDA